ncbi:MAG TPA: DUF1622 domain-containing protein [Phycisphaerales bacterium]|nr:DUF1622 domain-containing protein [Phycisphaerales bacterium]
MTFRDGVELVGLGVDATGVLVILAGAAFAGVRALQPPPPAVTRYRRLRQDLGRAILLGLELLVAADIIRTVAVPPTMEGVLVLGLIVLIRTVLSFSLEVELEGRWPWARGGGMAPTK